MRTMVLIGLAVTAVFGTVTQADSIIEDPIIAYIKVPLLGGFLSRWYVYSESGFVGLLDDDLPEPVLVNSVSSPYFELTWMLNLTGASVLTRDEAFDLTYCVTVNSPDYRKQYQLPPHPDEYEYIDDCLRKLGYRHNASPTDSSPVE